MFEAWADPFWCKLAEVLCWILLGRSSNWKNASQVRVSQVGMKKDLEGKISHCLDMRDWGSPWRATENRDNNKVTDWENVIFATQFLSWYEMNLNKRFSYEVFFNPLCSLVELICLMLLSMKGNSKLYEWRGDLPQIPANFMFFIICISCLYPIVKHLLLKKERSLKSWFSS